MKNKGLVDLGGIEATNAADPTSATSLATKSYVDAVATGLDIKASCRLATAAALPANLYSNGASGVGATLTGVSVGALTVDGVAVAVGDRILVKNEATGSRNGIYRVTTVGSGIAVYVLTRATDFDQAADLSEGDFTFIEEGTANATEGWVLTTAGPFTVGTTSLTFTQFTAAGEYTAGSGITIVSNAIAADFGTTAGKVTQGNDSRLSDPWTVVRKTADETVNNSAVLQNDDELFFTAANGVMYEVDAFLLYNDSVGTTADLKVAWGEDGSIRGVMALLAILSAADSPTAAGTAVGTNQVATAAAGTRLVTNAVKVVGWHLGAGGTFRLLWAQNTAGVSNTKILAGSRLRYRAIT